MSRNPEARSTHHDNNNNRHQKTQTGRMDVFMTVVYKSPLLQSSRYEVGRSAVATEKQQQQKEKTLDFFGFATASKCSSQVFGFWEVMMSDEQ